MNDQPKPNSDIPGTERLLHTDTVSESLALWLTDQTSDPDRGNDLLTLKSALAPKQRGVTGTGDEMADIARAILAHVQSAQEPDDLDAEMDLQRLQAHLTHRGAAGFYHAIREMGAGRPCPDASEVEF